MTTLKRLPLYVIGIVTWLVHSPFASGEQSEMELLRQMFQEYGKMNVVLQVVGSLGMKATIVQGQSYVMSPYRIGAVNPDLVTEATVLIDMKRMNLSLDALSNRLRSAEENRRRDQVWQEQVQAEDRKRAEENQRIRAQELRAQEDRAGQRARQEEDAKRRAEEARINGILEAQRENYRRIRLGLESEYRRRSGSRASKGLFDALRGDSELRVQTFIVTQGAENIKLGLVNVYVFSPDTILPDLIRKIDSHIKSINYSKEKWPLSEDDFFPIAGAALASATSDADGRCTFTLPTNGQYVVVAKSSRRVVSKTEQYYWLVWSSFDGKKTKDLLLSNSNLSTSGSDDSVLQFPL